jgi:poly(ADP-ribose) glycohydrolase ARH3
LGTFVGDALGMPYEGMPAAAIPDAIEMRSGRLPAGHYTDDTEMMIALAESLLRCGVADAEDLAASFRSSFDARRGYGGGTLQVMELWRRGVPVATAAQQVFDGRGSFGNGAAMRVAPVAVRFAGDEVLVDRQARASARVTQAHPQGVDGAAVQAAAIAGALEDDDIFAAATAAAETVELRDGLGRVDADTRAGLDPAALRSGADGVPPTAALSVPAAIAAGARAGSFEEAVTVAVRAGGDTDTVAAMAGAIAGARFGAAAIPARWTLALERGPLGREYVEQLARSLAEASTTAVMHRRGPQP